MKRSCSCPTKYARCSRFAAPVERPSGDRASWPESRNLRRRSARSNSTRARRRPFDAPDALAAVVRDNSEQIRQLVDRLEAREPAVAEGRRNALFARSPGGRGGSRLHRPALGDRHPRRLARSLGGHHALGRRQKGRTSPWTRCSPIHQSRSQSSGAALTALGDIARQPDKVVPRLIEAFEDYQEEDSEWLYYSQHERGPRATSFGEAAIPAIPALVARVRREDELDKGVIETLRKLGPAAAKPSRCSKNWPRKRSTRPRISRIPRNWTKTSISSPLPFSRSVGRRPVESWGTVGLDCFPAVSYIRAK